jgi:signal transduction histidine kinase
MLGLRKRLSLIVAGSLALVALAWVIALRVQQNLVPGDDWQMPLPEQAAGIVSLIESAKSSDLPTVLSAVNSASLIVSVDGQRPPVPPDQRVMPLMAWTTGRYLEHLGGHFVEVTTDSADPSNDHPIRLVVTLKDGRFVLIEARTRLLRYVLYMRLVIGTILSLSLIGGLSLWLLGRQLFPLERVVAAVDQFGEQLEAPEVDAGGVVEISRLATAFNSMQKRIRALVDGRTRMLAAISHDLGTYLTRLRLRVEYIADEDQRNRAVVDIESMQSLIDDALVLGRLQQEMGLTESIDLLELVRRLAATIDDPRARITSLAPALVRGQRQGLGRVFLNLVGNALKHGGSAEISVLVEGARSPAELRVEDRGPGIAPALRELVLEPFFRGDAARNLDVAGSGLGLAIVADIVRRHGGQLALEDRPGGGLRARVLLPQADGTPAWQS